MSEPPRRIRLEWVVGSTLGGLLGLSLPTLVVASLHAADVEATVPLAALALMLAGPTAGLILGYLQARVLTEHGFPMLPRHWSVATALATSFAWGTAFPVLAYGDALADRQPVLGMIAIIGVAASFLFAVGIAQWLVVRHRMPQAGRWVLANAAGWAIALAFTALMFAFAPAHAGLGITTFVGIVAGTGMGAIVGVFTMDTVQYWERRRASWTVSSPQAGSVTVPASGAG